MQVIELRRFIRHPLCMPLSYKIIPVKLKENQETTRSTTINVGLGGLLFSSKKSVKPQVMIMINMPFESKVFNVKAKVLRCEKNKDSGLYDIAVCFLRIQEAFKVKIIEQIYLIAEYRDLLSLRLGRDVSMEEASKKWIKLYSAKFRKLYW